MSKTICNETSICGCDKCSPAHYKKIATEHPNLFVYSNDGTGRMVLNEKKTKYVQSFAGKKYYEKIQSGIMH